MQESSSSWCFLRIGLYHVSLFDERILADLQKSVLFLMHPFDLDQI
nr:MAG TPA: hypothetical protein [Caudoviricetes sp.]